MSKGFIALHRKIFENDLYFLEPFTKMQAWIDLLLLANHKKSYIQVHDKMVLIKRGQIGWARRNLSKRWKWSRGKLNRFLDYLKNEQQIVPEENFPITVLTIVNYEKYQFYSTTGDTTDSTTSSTITTMINNEDNTISGKNHSAVSLMTSNSPSEGAPAPPPPQIPHNLQEEFALGGWTILPPGTYRWFEHHPPENISKAFSIGVEKCGYNPPTSYVQAVLQNLKKRQDTSNKRRSTNKYQSKTHRKNIAKQRSKFASHPAGATNQ